MRAVVALIFWAVSGHSLAQPPHTKALDAIRSWAKAGTEPIIAEQPRQAVPAQKSEVAIVQLTTDSAMLVVADEVRPGTHEIVAKSKPFALSRAANFGAWVEDFRFNPPDRIELSVSLRNGCARRVDTHRFVFRNGVWMVSGLDTAVMRCTDHAVEQDFTESTNYLTGKAVRTVFQSSKRPKSSRLASPRTSFPLSDFPPHGPEGAYADLQQ